MNYRQKKADAYLDAIQGGVAHQGLNALSRMTGLDRYVDNLGGTVNSAGSLLGLFQGEAPTLEELDEMENNNYGWVPGNATRRTMLRRRMVNKLLGGKPSTIYSEKWGPGVAGVVSMLGGGALGALTAGGLAAVHGREDAPGLGLMGGLGGMTIGALTALLANNIGAARAAMTPNRTDEEQQEYEQAKSQWKNWLIPGYARYNWYKSLGVSNRKLKEYQDKKKKDKEDMKKESSYEKIAFGITDKMIKQATRVGQTEYFGSSKPQRGKLTSSEMEHVYPGKTMYTDPNSGEQYFTVQTPGGEHYSINPQTGHYVPYQQGLFNNVQYGTRFPQTLTPAQRAVNSAASPIQNTTPNQRADSYINNVKGRLTPREQQFVPQVVANQGPLMYRERSRQKMDNQQPYVDPNVNPVQEGTNSSNMPYTPNAVARNSNGENYNTFEKGWMQNSLAPKPQPQQPAFNPETTPGWGLWTPKQIRDYAPKEQQNLTPEEFAQQTTPEQRHEMIQNKTKADRQVKINGSAENWDNVRADVESTIRTPYQVARWKQLGKTDEEIDAYVKRETDKAMQRRYGARPEEAPVMTPGVTGPEPILMSEEDLKNVPSDSTGKTTDVLAQPGVNLTNKVSSYVRQDRGLGYNKQASFNIIPLLFNEKSSSIVKRLLNGNDLTGR